MSLYWANSDESSDAMATPPASIVPSDSVVEKANDVTFPTGACKDEDGNEEDYIEDEDEDEEEEDEDEEGTESSMNSDSSKLEEEIRTRRDQSKKSGDNSGTDEDEDDENTESSLMETSVPFKPTYGNNGDSFSSINTTSVFKAVPTAAPVKSTVAEPLLAWDAEDEKASEPTITFNFSPMSKLSKSGVATATEFSTKAAAAAAAAVAPERGEKIDSDSNAWSTGAFINTYGGDSQDVLSSTLSIEFYRSPDSVKTASLVLRSSLAAINDMYASKRAAAVAPLSSVQDGKITESDVKSFSGRVVHSQMLGDHLFAALDDNRRVPYIDTHNNSDDAQVLRTLEHIASVSVAVVSADSSKREWCKSIIGASKKFCQSFIDGGGFVAVPSASAAAAAPASVPTKPMTRAELLEMRLKNLSLED